MTTRDERIEEYYEAPVWILAEWLVDLEDELEQLRHRLEGLEK